MIFEEKTIILKDGRTAILKSPCVEDAEKLLNYIKKSCKLYEMTSLADCPFVLWVGNRRMIKRRIFDEYIEQMYSI